MGQLSSEQRNHLYVQEAVRSGVHKAILAALYQVQAKPSLSDGETGLGIAPANQMTLERVDTFITQVQYAANTVRSLTNNLIAAGWSNAELWDVERGRYTDRLIEAIAAGYTPPVNDLAAALLEACDKAALIQAYSADLTTDARAAQLPITFLDCDAACLLF